MKFRQLALLAAVAAATASPAQQPAAQPAAPAAARQATAAERFGVRESVQQIDISPDGRHVVYLQPGPGRSTIVYISDLGSDGEARVVARSSGNPERLRACNFVTNDRLVCRISGMTEVQGI